MNEEYEDDRYTCDRCADRGCSKCDPEVFWWEELT